LHNVLLKRQIRLTGAPQDSEEDLAGRILYLTNCGCSLSPDFLKKGASVTRSRQDFNRRSGKGPLLSASAGDLLYSCGETRPRLSGGPGGSGRDSFRPTPTSCHLSVLSPKRSCQG